MAHKAIEIAKTFLTLSNPEYGDFLSNLKLQKLLYYAQGLHLALYDRPLFEEPILSWQYGPVVKDVYHEYKDFEMAIPVPKEFNYNYLTSEELDLIKDVYNVFGQFSAFKLVEMTHNEPPWKNTPINTEIRHHKLKQYFSTLVNEPNK